MHSLNPCYIRNIQCGEHNDTKKVTLKLGHYGTRIYSSYSCETNENFGRFSGRLFYNKQKKPSPESDLGFPCLEN